MGRAASAARIHCVALALLVVACDEHRPADSRAGGATSSVSARPPGYVVDSILPPEEALRRFRAGTLQASRLDGPGSRDSLVSAFFAALRRGDRGAIDRLAIDRTEFAWLVYPETRTSKPPYRQPPEIAWLLLRNASGAGLSKLMQRASGIDPVSYRCEDAEPEGRMRMWTDCIVTARYDRQTREIRLFGTILELGGRYKFAGFDNDL